MKDAVKLVQELARSFDAHVAPDSTSRTARGMALKAISDVMWHHRKSLSTKDISDAWDETQVRDVMES